MPWVRSCRFTAGSCNLLPTPTPHTVSSFAATFSYTSWLSTGTAHNSVAQPTPPQAHPHPQKGRSADAEGSRSCKKVPKWRRFGKFCHQTGWLPQAAWCPGPTAHTAPKSRPELCLGSSYEEHASPLFLSGHAAALKPLQSLWLYGHLAGSAQTVTHLSRKGKRSFPAAIQ